MSHEHHKPDWSSEYWKDMLIYQRRGMIRDDSFPTIVAWLELKPGMEMVDVGCGLGYLGYTFWPYFGEGGKYTGLDLNAQLIEDAGQNAHQLHQCLMISVEEPAVQAIRQII